MHLSNFLIPFLCVAQGKVNINFPAIQIYRTEYVYENVLYFWLNYSNWYGNIERTHIHP